MLDFYEPALPLCLSSYEINSSYCGATPYQFPKVPKKPTKVGNDKLSTLQSIPHILFFTFHCALISVYWLELREQLIQVAVLEIDY